MIITEELYREIEELGRSMLDEKGYEIPSPRTLFVAGRLKRAPTLKEQIQRVIRTTLSEQAMSQGFETFNESQDFDVPDDIDDAPDSIYTIVEEEFIPEASEGVTVSVPTVASDEAAEPEAEQEVES